MMYPKELRYSKEHEWIRDEGGAYAVGITDYAAAELGDITYVELPELGADLKRGDVAGTVESVKAASDVYAPVSGRVSEINDELEGAPELVNQSPYDDGWFFRMTDVDPLELRKLMDADAYETYIAGLDK
jgi:glycine cleavage system H protein